MADCQDSMCQRRLDRAVAQAQHYRRESERFREMLRLLVNAAEPWALSDTELAHAVNDGRAVLGDSSLTIPEEKA